MDQFVVVDSYGAPYTKPIKQAPEVCFKLKGVFPASALINL